MSYNSTTLIYRKSWLAAHRYKVNDIFVVCTIASSHYTACIRRYRLAFIDDVRSGRLTLIEEKKALTSLSASLRYRLNEYCEAIIAKCFQIYILFSIYQKLICYNLFSERKTRINKITSYFNVSNFNHILQNKYLIFLYFSCLALLSNLSSLS